MYYLNITLFAFFAAKTVINGFDSWKQCKKGKLRANIFLLILYLPTYIIEGHI